MTTYKQGEKIKLLNTGNTYSTWGISPTITINETRKLVTKYIERYNPINAKKKDPFMWTIYSGYYTPSDLSKRQDLRWKIRLISKNGDFTYYLISSNENHILVTNARAIAKL